MNEDKKNINKKIKKEDDGNIKLGVYAHYKNGNEYLVLYSGCDYKTKKEIVIYKALYGDFKVWARSSREFFEKVKKDGARVPRFKLVNEIGEENAFENKYKRALADYQNLLKQTAKEKEDFFKYASEALLYDIIPVYDNLKISMAHVDEAASKNGWAQGIKYVIKQFRDALDNNGIKEIKTVGQKFDHHTMEAVEGKGEKVIKEVKPGYKLRDKVIIPAKVVLEDVREEKKKKKQSDKESKSEK